MPTVTFVLDYAGRPAIELYVGLSAAAQETLLEAGPAPPPLRVRALLDTGASQTVIERRYLEELGATLAGSTRPRPEASRCPRWYTPRVPRSPGT